MNNSRMGSPIEILLVEDNPGDVRLAREALKENKVLNNLHVVEEVSPRCNSYTGRVTIRTQHDQT